MSKPSVLAIFIAIGLLAYGLSEAYIYLLEFMRQNYAIHYSEKFYSYSLYIVPIMLSSLIVWAIVDRFSKK